MSARPLPLLVIAGPTATGKTRLALEVAREVGGEILSADAFQIYRGLEIGTAQPTAEERGEIPFHLVGEIPPEQPFTVAQFKERAEAAIAEISARGKLPLLCGGTGLYFRTLLRHYDLPPPPGPEGIAIRQRLHEEAERLGEGAMHDRLRAVDPASALRLGPGNARRVLRALEVWELTGRPLSERSGVDPTPAFRYNASTYVLTCPRRVLYERIERRVAQMLGADWLEEVRALQQAGFTPDLPALRALGYAELLATLEGRATLPEATEAIRGATRRFAKRQLTWFRREYGFTWMTWENEAQWARFSRHLCGVAGGLL